MRLTTNGAYGTVMLDEEHTQSLPGPYSSSEVVLRRVNVRLDSGDIVRVAGESMAILELVPPCPPHEWDAGGERCVKCGEKDWMTAGVPSDGSEQDANG